MTDTIVFYSVTTGEERGRWIRDGDTISSTPGSAQSVLDAPGMARLTTDQIWGRYSTWSNGYFASMAVEPKSAADLVDAILNGGDLEAKGIPRFLWRETLHPRGPGGKFASKPDTSTRTPYRARRTRVGGRLGGLVGGHDYEAEFGGFRSRFQLPDAPDMPDVPDVGYPLILPMAERGEYPLDVIAGLAEAGDVITPPQGQEATVVIKKGPLGGVVHKAFHTDYLPLILVQNGIEPAGRSPKRWARESVRSEVEGAKVAEVFGVLAPRVEQTDDYSIVSEMIPFDSMAPSDWVEPGKHTSTPSVQPKLARLLKDPDEGGRMALFDFVTGNKDRHDGNTLISDGHLASIDHSNLLRSADLKEDLKVKTLGGFKPWMYAIQNQWFDYDLSSQRVTHPWTITELQEYRRKIEELDVSAASRKGMLHRLDLLIQTAKPLPPKPRSKR